MCENLFDGKVLMITGGTGSFGNAVLTRFLDTEIKEIRIFSRDEKKQDDMRKAYRNEKITFHIGDVRDPEALNRAMYGVDYVFHAAALKQVPSCEFFPFEAVKTNILGTQNVLSAALRAGVKKVVCLSTDKAAYPINAMGASKAMMEKVALSMSRSSGEMLICCTRYGNVLCSRGSVVPLFIEQIKSGNPLLVTNPAMTRFLMTLEDAVELVLFAFKEAHSGDLFIQKAPACTVAALSEAVRQIFAPDTPVKCIGTRHGEKLFETLMTAEERIRSRDLGQYWRIPLDGRDLNYGMYFEDGSPELDEAEPFTSHNTERLSADAVKSLLLKLPYIKEQLHTWRITH